MNLLLKIGLVLLLLHWGGQSVATNIIAESEGGVASVSEGKTCLTEDEDEPARFSVNFYSYNVKSYLTHVVNVEEMLSFTSRWLNHQVRTAERMMMYFRNIFSIVLQKERERRFPSVKFHHAFPPCDFYVFTLRKILV